MTELFCITARRTRVLLWIGLAASAIALCAGIYETIGAYNAVDDAANWENAIFPLIRDALGKTAVYILILLAARPVQGDTIPSRIPRVLLLCAFGLRSAAALQVSAALMGESPVSMLVTARDVSALVAVIGVPVLLLAKNAAQTPQNIRSLFNLAALVSAMTLAYMAVVGVLDGQISWLDGLVGTLPEALFGVVLAVFYSSLRNPKA